MIFDHSLLIEVQLEANRMLFLFWSIVWLRTEVTTPKMPSSSTLLSGRRWCLFVAAYFSCISLSSAEKIMSGEEFAAAFTYSFILIPFFTKMITITVNYHHWYGHWNESSPRELNSTFVNFEMILFLKTFLKKTNITINVNNQFQGSQHGIPLEELAASKNWAAAVKTNSWTFKHVNILFFWKKIHFMNK